MLIMLGKSELLKSVDFMLKGNDVIFLEADNKDELIIDISDYDNSQKLENAHNKLRDYKLPLSWITH